MEWKKLLAYITGSVDQELLLRNAYLVTGNRILRQQIPGRVRLTNAERKTLAEMGQKRVWAHHVMTLGVQSTREVCYCSLSPVRFYTVPGFSMRAGLVVLSCRRIYHDYADYLGEITGRHLA
jgi:hypothetical protein